MQSKLFIVGRDRLPGVGLRISTRNARFQEWQALLSNRRKRLRAGEFLVQGVRPITLAVQHGWPIRALIYAADRPLSGWAESVLTDATAADRIAMSADLIRELGEKNEEIPELIAVVAMPADDYARIRVTAGEDVLRYVVLKGSIAVDGVSLTVNAIPDDHTVQLSLIDFTLKATTLGALRAGHRVQVEADVIGKYIQRLVAPHLAAAAE